MLTKGIDNALIPEYRQKKRFSSEDQTQDVEGVIVPGCLLRWYSGQNAALVLARRHQQARKATPVVLGEDTGDYALLTQLPDHPTHNQRQPTCNARAGHRTLKASHIRVGNSPAPVP